MASTVETEQRLEVVAPMRMGLRVVLALAALLPLLAPYELLLRPGWQDWRHPFFLLAALVSAGAVALSLLLLFAAVAGQSARLVIDTGSGQLMYRTWAPLPGARSAAHPLSALVAFEVGQREWSDGAPTFHLRVLVSGGAAYEMASSWSRDDVESIRLRIEAFLARHRGGDAGSRIA